MDDAYEFKEPGKEQTWIAYRGDVPVGFATGVLKDKTTFYLARVGVLKEHRKHGLGRRLIGARKRYAKTIGCKKMITYTVTINTASNKNLIAQGFQPFKAQKYGDKYILLWWDQKL